MNLSPEMLKRFERLYVEQQDHYWRDKPYPQELTDDPELHEQFMDWRVLNKDAPLDQKAAQYIRDHLAKVKAAQQAQEGEQAEA